MRSSSGDPIGGVFETVLDLSRAFPVLGMIAAGGLAGLSIYVQRLPSSLLNGKVHLLLVVTWPLACLCMLMAVVGFMTRRSGERERQYTTPEGLCELDPEEFLKLVAQGYQRRGLEVGRADSMGYDLLLRNKDGEDLLVYARYQGKKELAEDDLRPLVSILSGRQREGILLVLTCGEISESALGFANEHGMILVDGRQLVGLTSASPEAPDPDYTPR